MSLQNTQVARQYTQVASAAEEMYLELLKRSLTRSGFRSFGTIRPPRGSLKKVVFDAVQSLLRPRGLAIARLPTDASGDDPSSTTAGETMMGMRRLNNIQDCVASVLRRNIPGDFIETGVWRGGGVIFMRALLKIYGDHRRVVWVADSFCGVPKPNAGLYPQDAGDELWKADSLSASLEEVKENFRRYGLLDDQVRFLPGWFRDTLPAAPIERLAILRLDGDIYESTMDALRHLYPKLSTGGRIIIDDYGAIRSCGAAVDDYRNQHGITEPMRMVDDRQQSCVYWEKGGDVWLSGRGAA